MMFAIACILAIIIGVTLGLIGSGGSILTIPILVYFLHIEPQVATVYSLFIVGVVAFIGSLKCLREKLLDKKITLLFGVPSVLSILVMRKCIFPSIPQIIFQNESIMVTKNLLIMFVFAVLMILSSFSMLRKRNSAPLSKTISSGQLIFQGIMLGMVTGFVGVGGGFLIIPVLIFYARLPMDKAVANSLIIIALNALLGFAGSVSDVEIDWTILLVFSLFATTGIYVGRYINRFLNNEKLKKGFGWFVMIMGVYILIKEYLNM